MKIALLHLALTLGLAAVAFSASARPSLDPAGLPGTHSEIISTTDITPKMAVQTSRMSEFGPLSILGQIGGAKSANEAAGYRAEFGIDDPALMISSLVAARLGELTSLPVRAVDSGLGDADSYMQNRIQSPADVAAKHGPGKLVVSASTQRWAFVKAASTYRLQLIANVQVVDTDTGKRLAREDCITRLSRDDAPDIATFLDNEAASMKAELDYGTRFCAAWLVGKLFGEESTTLRAASKQEAD